MIRILRKFEIQKINKLLTNKIVNTFEYQYSLIFPNIFFKDGQKLINFFIEIVLKIDQVNICWECFQDLKFNQFVIFLSVYYIQLITQFL